MGELNALEILLIEDDTGDVELTRESLKDSRQRFNLHVVKDGAEAAAFLRKEGKYAQSPLPDLILLDLNLPRRNGKQVLAELKRDQNLKMIPVIVWSTSSAKEDIMETYDLGANCYITKPIGLSDFTKVVQAIEGFWFTVAKLPTRAKNV